MKLPRKAYRVFHYKQENSKNTWEFLLKNYVLMALDIYGASKMFFVTNAFADLRIITNIVSNKTGIVI